MARAFAHEPGAGRAVASALIRAAAVDGLALPVQRLLTDGATAAVLCASVNLVVWLARRVRALPSGAAQRR